MRVAIVNAFYPPDGAVTGRSAHSLAERLRTDSPAIEVTVFATDGAYGEKGEPSADESGVVRIRAARRGTTFLGRLRASIWDGVRLAFQACRRADVVVALTDPPLLALWVAAASRLYGRSWVEWTMDLYPEAFAAAGVSSSGNIAFRAIVQAQQRWAPVRYVCLGPLQHEYLRRHRRVSRPAFILPCGVVSSDGAVPPPWTPDGRIVIAYAGNVGQAHSATLLANVIRRANPGRVRFVLSIYGTNAAELRGRLERMPHIEWFPRLTPNDLAHADVHLVSLRGAWRHVCVPSKAVAALCLSRPVLFAGPADCDTWAQIGEAGWLIPEQPDGSYTDADIDRALNEIEDPVAVAACGRHAAEAGAALREAETETLKRIARWLGDELRLEHESRRAAGQGRRRAVPIAAAGGETDE